MSAEEDELRNCARPECRAPFYPAHKKQKYCRAACRQAVENARAAAKRVTRVRRPRKKTGGLSGLYWYRVLDTIHYWQLSLPVLIPGVASIHRRHWIRLFYRTDGSDPALRAWERFKSTARKAGIAVDARPDVGTDESGQSGFAGAQEGYLHLDIGICYAAAFAKLGPPHPAGEEAEIEALEAAEAEDRSALIERFATAIRYLETTRRPEPI